MALDKSKLETDLKSDYESALEPVFKTLLKLPLANIEDASLKSSMEAQIDSFAIQWANLISPVIAKITADRLDAFIKTADVDSNVTMPEGNILTVGTAQILSNHSS